MKTKLFHLAPIVLLTLAVTGAPNLAAAHPEGGYGHGHEHHDDGRGRYGPATLTVRNDFDGTLDLWVDGRYVETISGNSTRNVMMRPGYRDVTLRRSQSGFVITRTQVALTPGRSQFLPVAAPMGRMSFQNASAVPMKVRVDGQTMWIDPNQRVSMTVETGNVQVATILRDPRGEWEAMSQTVWLEPGQDGFQALRAESGLVLVTNYERFAVRILIDGVDAGFVGPGDTRRVFVRFGSASFVLVDPAGRARETTSVYVTRGREERVVFQSGRGAVAASYGPVQAPRPDADHHDGYGHDEHGGYGHDDHDDHDDHGDHGGDRPEGPRGH